MLSHSLSGHQDDRTAQSLTAGVRTGPGPEGKAPLPCAHTPTCSPGITGQVGFLISILFGLRRRLGAGNSPALASRVPGAGVVGMMVLAWGVKGLRGS